MSSLVDLAASLGILEGSQAVSGSSGIFRDHFGLLGRLWSVILVQLGVVKASWIAT